MKIDSSNAGGRTSPGRLLDPSAPRSVRRGTGDAGPFLVLLTGITSLRLVFLLFSGLELSPDESYYWDWSRQLDWGYYSKPPLIAWVIAFSTALFGDNAFGVRLPAVLFSAGTGWFLFLAAGRSFGSRAGWFAGALFLLTPAHAVLSLVINIDPPVLFFWAVALWAVIGATAKQEVNRPNPGLAPWVFAGVATALGVLSKQTMLAFPALVLMAFLLHGKGREQLRLPGPWIAAAIGGIGLIPIIAWNLEHDWIMLGHTADHFGAREPASRTLIDGLQDSSELLGALLGLLSPVTAILIGVASLTFVAAWNRLHPDRWILLWLGPLPIVAVLVLSFFQRVQPNWPAPFFLASLVLLAGWLAAHEGRERLFRRAAMVGAACMMLVYAAPFLAGPGGLFPRMPDATKRLKGWGSLAEQVDAARREAGAKDLPVLAATHRQPVSALAFYLPDQPRVHRWNPAGVIDSQHGLWPGLEAYQGEDVFIFSNVGPTEFARLASVFSEIEPVGEARRINAPPERQHYSLHLGRNLLAWPPPEAAGEGAEAGQTR